MKIDSLTFPRFIAAFALVIHHFAGNFPAIKNTPAANFVEVSSTLVSFFYVLSGFILVVAYSKGAEANVINKKKFFVNRFARIYPVYFLALVLYLFLPVQARLPEETASMGQVVTSFLLIHAWIPKYAMCLNFPAWSLSAEMFFYLLFPFLYSYFLRSTSRNILILVSSAWVVNLFWYTYMMNHNFNFYFREYHPINHLATFMLGVGWGVVFVRHHQQLKKYTRLVNLIFVMLLGISFVLIYTAAPIINYHHNGLFAPLFLAGILALSLKTTFLSRLFSAKALVFLGEISYGVYILQVPVLFWLKYFNAKGLAMDKQQLSLLYITVLLTLSAISYLTFEKSARSYFKRLA